MKNTNNTLPWRGMVWAGLVTTAVLGGIYLKAADHLRKLTSTLARLEAESARTEPQVAALRNEVDATTEDIAAIVSGPTGTVEEVRRNANLAAIARLKSAREANSSAPPPPPLRMPSGIGIAGGMVIPELINDPEYRAAYLTHIRKSLRQTQSSKLRRLGLSEEASEKVITVMAEHEAATYDYRQLTGNKSPGRVPDAIAKSIAEDTNNQLRQIMGAEIYKGYEESNARKKVTIISRDGASTTIPNSPTQEVLVVRARNAYLTPLATRLSYSDSPLQSAQTDQLAELLAMNSSPDPRRSSLSGMSPAQLQSQLEQARVPIYRAMYTDSFIEQASKLLNPVQLEALRQLQAEHFAYDVRAKLPKSSELPRNAPVAK